MQWMSSFLDSVISSFLYTIQLSFTYLFIDSVFTKVRSAVCSVDVNKTVISLMELKI
jgi:hypothetical protein